MKARNVVIGLLAVAVLWAGGLATWVVVTDSSGPSDRERFERCEEAESVLDEIVFGGALDLIELPTEEWEAAVATSEEPRKDAEWNVARYC